MATTAAENSPKRAKRDRTPTTLDSHIDRPSVVEPGDAPYDTTDPLERATSVSPDKAAAAAAGHGTVNAVIPLPEPDRLEEPAREARTETYDAIGPDGKKVTVTRNLETGESSRR
ncbi:hypothetical protein [Actinomycetospora aeridis]|uniref:Uncharacterized protein n=1 Tax=Actinomycetospora aeridis TaxID=3129231 RepID=A0ABU8N1B5_9PSEU